MNPLIRLRWIYALMILFVVWVGVQMSMYIANLTRDDGLQSAIVHYGVVSIVIGYTLITVVRRVLTQAYLTWKWRKHFRSRQHVKLTKRLAGKYRNLGADILVIRDEAFIALAIGLWKPTIVVSSAVLDMFSDDEVKAIILHEWHHCRNRDNAKLFLTRLLTEGFGYLPIMSPIFRYYQTWTELIADRFAIRQMGTELPLASVLLKLSKLKPGRQYTAAVHFAAATTMHYRIAQVLEPNRTVQVKVALLRPLLASLSLLLLLMLGGDS